MKIQTNKIKKIFKSLKSKLNLRKSNKSKTLLQLSSQSLIVNIKSLEQMDDIVSNLPMDNSVFLSIQYNNLPSNDVLAKLYLLKKQKRMVFTLLEIDDQMYSIKEIIKTAIEYGCDGFYIKQGNESDILNLANIVSKLPTPYDFEWKIYYKMNGNKIISSSVSGVLISNVNQSNFITNATDFKNQNNLNYPTSTFILEQTEINNSKDITLPALPIHKHKNGSFKIKVDLKLKK